MNTATTTATNPLVTARADAGESKAGLARVIGCSEAVVKWAEAGCFNIIPICYKVWNPELVNLNGSYQNFRTEKRRVNFKVETFPERAPETMQALLRHFNLKPYSFGMVACLQHNEIYMLMQGRKVNLSSNFTAFFIAVGLDQQWIQDFNSNINQASTLGKGV